MITVWHCPAMVICDCDTPELIEDAATDGVSAWMIVSCPMCEAAALYEMKISKLRHWDDEAGDWGEPERLKIH